MLPFAGVGGGGPGPGGVGIGPVDEVGVTRDDEPSFSCTAAFPFAAAEGTSPLLLSSIFSASCSAIFEGVNYFNTCS